jgi:hypothetical protein
MASVAFDACVRCCGGIHRGDFSGVYRYCYQFIGERSYKRASCSRGEAIKEEIEIYLIFYFYLIERIY